jgi:hypothetical protein
LHMLAGIADVSGETLVHLAGNGPGVDVSADRDPPAAASPRAVH